MKQQRSYTMMIVNLCSGALLVLSALYFTVPIVTVISSEFEVSTTTAALSGTAFSLFFACGCLVYGPLSSRLGRKKVMVAGLLGLAAATLLTVKAQSFTELLLLRCLQGATASTFSPVALTYAGEMFPEGRRVSVIGYISTGLLMSGIVGQVASSALTYWLGWQSLFLVFGIAYMLLVISFILFLPEAPKAGLASMPNNVYGTSNTRFASKSLLFCYFITFTVLLCFVGAYSALEFYLSKAPFLLDESAILAIRAAGIAGMLLCPFAGRLCNRYGKPIILRIGLTLAVGGLLLLGIMKQPLLYALVSIVFVSGIALVVPSLIALIGELGRERRALATSLYTFILFVGASLGPIAALQLIHSNWLGFSVYHSFACLFLISLMCSLFVREPSSSTVPSS